MKGFYVIIWVVKGVLLMESCKYQEVSLMVLFNNIAYKNKEDLA